MAANHNSPEPEGTYDPAGSTQMFRAFVEEAEPARTPSVPGARRRAKGSSGAKGGLNVGLVVALVLVLGAAVWVVVH
ncbi:hypothetical protein ACGFXC_13380 [Streptomyces sp. NPDC048507]|uniref:hypothetical protein n=1 Tax=Streptomyces sp. NPDC048507 TaxID=3365560 RepID=UPI00371ACF8C